MSRRKQLARCGKTGRVIIHTELDAKIILASRIRRDKGERSYVKCGNHYHLSTKEWNQEVAAGDPL